MGDGNRIEMEGREAGRLVFVSGVWTKIYSRIGDMDMARRSFRRTLQEWGSGRAIE